MTNRLDSAAPVLRSLTCAQCGIAFSCGLSTTCWCADETARLPMPTGASDCLCPGCMRNLAGIPAPLGAVLFDMDGTLLDTEQMNHHCFVFAMAELGYPDGDELGRAMVGLPSAECDALLRTRFGEDFPTHEVDRRFDVRRATILRDNGISLKRGVRALLDALGAARTPMAVVTSSSRRTAEQYLTLAGIRDRFAALVTRDDVSHGKPNPEPYLLAARQLDVAPRACLAIEDSAPGVASAHAAGVVTLLVPDMLEPQEAALRKAMTVLPDLYAVLKLLPSAEIAIK